MKDSWKIDNGWNISSPKQYLLWHWYTRRFRIKIPSSSCFCCFNINDAHLIVTLVLTSRKQRAMNFWWSPPMLTATRGIVEQIYFGGLPRRRNWKQDEPLRNYFKDAFPFGDVARNEICFLLATITFLRFQQNWNPQTRFFLAALALALAVNHKWCSEKLLRLYHRICQMAFLSCIVRAPKDFPLKLL